MKETRTLLIIGGYGTFGGRLVELLENELRLTLIVAGRSMQKAQIYCRKRGQTSARLVPVAFDREAGSFQALLNDHQPDIVVDASGPFQDYGQDRYALVEACIMQKVNYLDLADGSGFVAGIKAFDNAARAAGIFVLSGVSSFPVLTACVVRELTADMKAAKSIRGGIAPSPYAGVGENVIRAIASYAGQTIKMWRNGATGEGWPFTESCRYTIAPPGLVPLENRLFSLVDVPDLQALPEIRPDARDVWMGAAPVPEILHRALTVFAWFVRLRWISSLSSLSHIMYLATNYARWGEDRGGMFVEVSGTTREGADCLRSWHLLAEGRDGPLIPSMAVEAIVRKFLAGLAPVPGARAPINDLKLADYDALFAKRTIFTGFREDLPEKAVSLYQSILGSAWNETHPEIRKMHDGTDQVTAKGVAHVERGNHWLAKIIASIMRFPQGHPEIPVRVHFTIRDSAEIWQRWFGDETFSSCQYAGKNRDARLLVEQFGFLRFAMALVPRDNRLDLVIRHWSALGIPMPLWLAPRSNSFEFVENGRFHFNVEIFHLLTGPIITYTGWLTRE